MREPAGLRKGIRSTFEHNPLQPVNPTVSWMDPSKRGGKPSAGINVHLIQRQSEVSLVLASASFRFVEKHAFWSQEGDLSKTINHAITGLLDARVSSEHPRVTITRLKHHVESPLSRIRNPALVPVDRKGIAFAQ